MIVINSATNYIQNIKKYQASHIYSNYNIQIEHIGNVLHL